MRAHHLALLLALAAPAVLAQTPPPAPLTRAPDGEPRHNQKIERIVIEDAGNRIDELRVGGQTRSVTVQPKAGVPSYEILPDDLARSRPFDRREGPGSGRQRVWNIGTF